MRRQERKTTERNKYNGDQLYVGDRRQDDNSFPMKKITFCFNCPRNPDADAMSQGIESSKDFKIRGVLEKERRSAGRTSYQADRHDYLPEVKIEITEQMPNRVNNRSARSAGTKKSEPEQRSAEDLI
jgi:hypothetical protein